MLSLSKQYLVITALGKDKPGIVNTIINEVSRAHCNIEDSRFGLFGDNFTFIMYLSGSWQEITQIEMILPPLAAKQDLLLMMKRTSGISTSMVRRVRIIVEVDDRESVIKKYTQLLIPHQMNIAELMSKTYLCEETNKQKLKIIISAQVSMNADFIELQKNIKALSQSLDAKYSISIVDYRENSNGEF